MKRSEYKKILKEIGLSKEQTEKIRAVIEDLMTRAERQSNDSEGYSWWFFGGKTSGLNTMDRFFRGDMDCHDEFDKE